MDNFINFFQSNKINIFDIIVAIIILYNLISSLKKGFVLSLIYFLKWIIAFIIAKFSIPYVLPYISKIIEFKQQEKQTHDKEVAKIRSKTRR